MANTTNAQSYIFTFKLISGYNVIQLPNNIIIPNLKKIFVRKLAYNFNQQYQYVGKLSIVGYDLHTYTDGVNTSSYTITLLNPSGALNNVVEYTNVTQNADINLLYGSSQSQFTIVFDSDYSDNGGSLTSMSTGGSPFVSQSNPLLLELELQ